MAILKKFLYDIAEKEFICCNCCGSKNVKEVFTKDRYSMGITTVICQNCGLVYTNPVLTDTELNNFYSFHYRHYYVSTNYPDTTYIQMRKLQERANILLSHIKSYLPHHLRLLDIGASEGTVLNTIHLHCKETMNTKAILKGVEPNQKFAEYAKKEHQLDIFEGMISDFLDKNLDSFNFIVLNHVLEHFKDPSSILKNLWCILEKDGYLFIEVPNLEYKHIDLSFFHIAHIFHFTPYTLEQLALKAGFIPVYKKLSSSTIHPWAMAYIFQKIEKNNLSISATETYITFLQTHIASVYRSIWKQRILFPFKIFKKIINRLAIIRQ